MNKEEQFETFWRAYPRRVAKGAARKAFDKAIKKTTLETMLEAVKKYITCKPEKIDFKHPATWLNSECWDDEWEVKTPTFAVTSHRTNFPAEEPRVYISPERRAEQAARARQLVREMLK
jgi:uncharacterized Zn-finger protein